MVTVLKGLRLRIVAVLLVILTVVSSCIYQQTRAEQAANAFCSSAKTGALIEPLAHDAAGIGERMLRDISSNRVRVGFVGISPFSRFTCTIDAQDGRITAAVVSHID